MKLHYCILVLISALACSATILHLGECETHCNLKLEEFCGENSKGEKKSFWDECDLQRYNCFSKNDFKKVSDGFCKDEDPFKSSEEKVATDGIVAPEDSKVETRRFLADILRL